MVDFKNEQLYRQDSIDKQLKITFDSGTITNTEIPSEQFELTESLTSESQLVFGSCEASEIKFRIYNVFLPLKDKWLTVTQTLNGDTENPLQIGKYKVYSDKPTADRSYRDVVAYDSMFDIINADVASWYNSLTFPMQLKTFRDSFFDYFGIDQEEVALVNDAMTIEKTIEPSVLSGKDVLQSICQINGCFGHIGRDGKMQYVFLNTIMGGLYPSNNIYPADDLYPMQPNINDLSKGLYVEPPTYEDYMVKPIDKLEIREKEGDIGVIVGSGNNAYVVEDNFLVYGKSTDDLPVIANNMLSVIDGLEYRPFDARLVGNPCFEVGDMVRLNTKHQIIDSYVLQRTLSGVQCLRDDFSAEGEEYQSEKVNDIQTDIKQLKGKSNTLERTIEETRSTIANMEEGLQSEISQTADAIRLEVSDNTGKISTIEQTVDGITQTVEDNTGKISTIEQTVDGITQTVEDNTGKISTIEQDIDSITQTVEDNTGKISTIEQDIDSITQTVEDNKKELSSRIEQTVKSISLTVNNGDSTAGIVITLENEDGTTEKVSGTIDMTGMVTFNDLKNKGQTVINGSNITTGQINCDLLNGGAIKGQSIDGCFIDGSVITASTLAALGTTVLESIQLGATENVSYSSTISPIYGVINPGVNDCLNISSELQVQQGIKNLGDFYSPNIYNSIAEDKSANVYVGEQGRLRRVTSSSKRYKKDITDKIKSELDCKNILNATIYQYKFKDGYLDKDDIHYGKDVIGFVVEDLEKHYPIAIEYVHDENGNLVAENWNARYIIPPMLKLIQEQHKQLETQQQEIDTLKEQVSFLMQKLGDDSND